MYYEPKNLDKLEKENNNKSDGNSNSNEENRKEKHNVIIQTVRPQYATRSNAIDTIVEKNEETIKGV